MPSGDTVGPRLAPDVTRTTGTSDSCSRSDFCNGSGSTVWENECIARRRDEALLVCMGPRSSDDILLGIGQLAVLGTGSVACARW